MKQSWSATRINSIKRTASLADSFSFAGLIVTVCLLNFTLRLNKLGLYEADWLFFGIYAQGGASALMQFQMVDRLLAGLPLVVPFVLFGTKVWLWHASIVGLHAATALLFYAILRRLFPQHILFCTLTAALFCVYPAVETLYYFAQALSSSSVFLTALSLFVMTLAVRRTRIIWALLVLSAALEFVALLIYELPLGLELVRPIVIWALISQYSMALTRRQKLKRTLLIWLPYLAMLLFYFVWRLFLYRLLVPGARPALVDNAGLVGLLGKLARNYSILFLSTWQAAVNRLLDPNAFWVAWLPLFLALVGAAIVLAWLWFARTRYSDFTEEFGNSARQPSWFRLAALGLVVTALGFVSSLPTPYALPLPNSLFSRIDLAATPGAALTLTALAFGFARVLFTRWQVVGTFGIALLIGLATGNNFIVQEQFVREWLSQQEMWWQLTARAPALQDGTLVLVVGPREKNALGRAFDDFEVAAALNFIYDRKTLQGEQVTANTLARLNPNGLGSQYENTVVPLDRILVAQYGQGCLKIVDSENRYLESNDAFANAVGHLSNMGNIAVNAAPTISPRAETILGKPQTNSWCNFYERAELARQKREWHTIVELLGQIQTSGLMPEDASEWLPFIEALERTGNYADADPLIFRVLTTADMRSRQELANTLEQVRQSLILNGDELGRKQTEKHLTGVKNTLGQ